MSEYTKSNMNLTRNILGSCIYNEICMSEGDIRNILTDAAVSDLSTIKGHIITDVTSKVNDIKNELDTVQPFKTALISNNFDPNQVYIPRSQRKEWDPVGLMGKLYVRDDGNCVVGQKCSCSNGIAVPGTDWYVMERKTPNIIRILYK